MDGDGEDARQRAEAAPARAGRKSKYAPGMDETAVGRAVTFELDRRERQKAARVRSQLSDID